MKRLLMACACAAALGLLAGCDKGLVYPSTTPAEAGTLKNFCEQQNIMSPEVRSADSLYSLGNVKLREGNRSLGYAHLDLAIIYYRLALRKQEFATAQKRFDESAAKLSEEQEQLATYREVLKEMKGGAK